MVVNYLESAEPFWIEGGPVGCLCSHGFMSSPGEMKWLAEFLASHNITCYGLRLAGHGTHYSDMRNLSWRDWYMSALDGYTLLAARCDRIILVGHSMGGLIQLLLASQKPVSGVVVLATPIEFRLLTFRLTCLLKSIIPFISRPDNTTLPRYVRQQQELRGEPIVGRRRYDLWSTSAICELKRLADETRENLAQVTVPVCLVYSERDTTALVRNAEVIAEQLGSKHIEKHILKESGHNLLIDTEHEHVFRILYNFIDERN